MARPLRIIYENAFYHITARGNERRTIFVSDRDYRKFLTYLREALQKYGCILHAFALMRNHYHLILQTPKANLSSFMHSVNSAYTTYFNIKRRRSGHLFQGRYKALLIDVDAYLLELSRYIHLNPVRAGVTEKPEDYRYSSYKAYILPSESSMVYRELTWSMIGGEEKSAAQSYRRFVECDLGQRIRSPIENVYGGAILGGKPFIKKVLHRLHDGGVTQKDISYKLAMRSVAPELDEIVKLVGAQFKRSREEVLSGPPYKGYTVYLARKHTTLTNAEIGTYFGGLSTSAVTKIGTRMKKRMVRDRRLRDRMIDLQEKLSRVSSRAQAQ